MDALRKSVGGSGAAESESGKKKPSTSVKSTASKEKKGISLVKPAKASGKRKSA
jgi:DNA end-binding protein Ku